MSLRTIFDRYIRKGVIGKFGGKAKYLLAALVGVTGAETGVLDTPIDVVRDSGKAVLAATHTHPHTHDEFQVSAPRTDITNDQNTPALKCPVWGAEDRQFIADQIAYYCGNKK